MRLPLVLTGVGCVIALAGCGSDSAGASPIDGDSGVADGGADATAHDAAEPEDAAAPAIDAATPPPDDDEERLYACEDEEPCGLSFAGIVEGSANAVTRERLRCTITALGDRVPGRYLHDTDSTLSTGSATARHTLRFNDDGSVSYVRRLTVDGERTVEEAQRCELKPASYFEACEAALHGDNEEGFRCAYGAGDNAIDTALEWFERCEPDSPLACD